MALLDQIAAEIGEPLAAVDRLLRDMLSAEANSAVREVTLYAAKGGKRVRAILTLLSARVFAQDVSAALPIAAAAEAIHLATLLHDDVIDGSHLRRYQTTVNAKWGNRIAVLAGDSLWARAVELLANEASSQILTTMMRMVRHMCDGEIMQLEFSAVGDEAERHYLTQIERKTAEFFQACCQCGALAVGATESQAQSMANFGRHVGMAYQIVDDLLDLVGDTADLGKPVGSDLKAGIITLPLLYLIRQNGSQSIQSESTTPLDQRKQRELVARLQDQGAVDYTMETARSYASQAKQALQDIPLNQSRWLLTATVDQLIERSG